MLALQGNITPADMLRIQLDDRAVFLARWRTLLLSVLDGEALRDQPRRVEFRRLIEGWNARASVDSVGYRLVRAYHDRTQQAVWDMLLAGLRLPAEQDAGPPAQFEAAFLSAAHTEAEIDQTVAAADEAIARGLASSEA